MKEVDHISKSKSIPDSVNVLESLVWAQEMAQWQVQKLPKPEDPSSTPGTHVKKMLDVAACKILCLPGTLHPPLHTLHSVPSVSGA